MYNMIFIWVISTNHWGVLAEYKSLSGSNPIHTFLRAGLIEHDEAYLFSMSDLNDGMFIWGVGGC